MNYLAINKIIACIVVLWFITNNLTILPSNQVNGFDGISWIKYSDENGAIPVVDVGDPNSLDHPWVSSPEVIRDDEVLYDNDPTNDDELYKMWYNGNCIRQYYSFRVFYATSPDGIVWNKYVDETGDAIPVIDLGGAPGGADDACAYALSIIKEGSTYKMWYSGQEVSTGSYRTLYATSVDCISWAKHGVVLNVGALGQRDERDAYSPQIIIDENASPSERYKMWYMGQRTSGPYKFFYTTSPDGIVWTKYADANGAIPVLEPGGAPGGFDDISVGHACVIKDDDGKYKMWYHGASNAGFKILYADSSDGIVWNKHGLAVDVGQGNELDSIMVGKPKVFKDINGIYKMWYEGSYDGYLRIFYAYSEPGNLPPVSFSGDDQTVYEGEVVQFNGSTSYDPDGNITKFEWDLDANMDSDGDGNPANDVDAKGPTPTHIYGDNGIFIVSLRVTDNQNLTDTDTCNITVLNVAPIIDQIQEYTINEFESVTLTGHATDPGSDDLTFTWNWGYVSWGDKTTTYYNDGLSPDPYPSPEINQRNITEDATCQYGDDGVFTVTLTVSDDDGGSMIVTTNVTVNNIDPIATIESTTMNVEISLRVAGSKWSNVGLTLYENDVQVGYLEVERWPGNPDDNPIYENPALPTILDMTKSYKAIVTYDPYPDKGDEIKGDQPNNGKDKQNNAGNPIWIIMKFGDGSEEKIHHTFNTQQSKKKDSEHWNHVEPWEVDLNERLVGHEFEVTSHITDPGSDDEFLTFTYVSQVVNVAYLNNPPNPDPYPSPETNPRDIIDTTTLTYQVLGALELLVEDDDGGKTIIYLDLR